MKKLLLLLPLILLLPAFLFSQPMDEGFESSDSLNLPEGWSKWNMAPFPIDPLWNWTVRDSGVCIPGINCIRTSKAYNSLKSAMVSWWTSIDTLSIDTTYISDAWLVTKQIRNIPSDGTLMFYACGGSTSYADSMQVWVGTSDSLPTNLTNYMLSINWPAGSIFANWQLYVVDLSSFAGQNIRIGFRYNMDCAVDGYVVFIDDVQVIGTFGITQIGTNVPAAFALHQNYPNPFNPLTKIRFDLAKNSNVKITVYNNLGQEVKVLVNEYRTAGYYETDFNASYLPSGVYFYRLETQYYTETKKMVVIK